MASTPTIGPQWPPSSDASFDEVLTRLLDLKAFHFPQHTARDPADPFVQLLYLVAALGSHALRRANSALKMMSPKTATSRAAWLSIMEALNRPLRPAVPSRGKVYAKLVAATPTASQTLVYAGTRVQQQGINDPNFTVDKDVATASSVAFSAWHDDTSAALISALPTGMQVTFQSGDSIIIGFKVLAFDKVTLTLTTPLSTVGTYGTEYYNEEWGTPNSVTNLGSQLKFRLETYLHLADSTIGKLTGLKVKVRHRPTGKEEEVAVTNDSGNPVATTSLLGQSGPSTAAVDYSVLAKWRPIPGATDTTSGLSGGSGAISFDFAKLRNSTDWWEEHKDYGYAVRIRHASGAAPNEAFKIGTMSGTGSGYYATAKITQGSRPTTSIGQTDGSTFQFIAAAGDPLEEPAYDPKVGVQVGADTAWTVVDDFSDSGPNSKHATFREDPDLGWGAMFGDGVTGAKPTSGQTVKVTFRTGSTAPGDVDPDQPLRITGDTGLVKDWKSPRGTKGYIAAEGSTKDSTKTLRNSIAPQLSLRNDSVVTAQEMETALSGGAPYRATFETDDGRKPFARAKYTTSSAGTRQYRVIVAGPTADGAVDTADLVQAEDWLNGKLVGIERVGGHGPQNTTALVGAFTPRYLTPTVTITITDEEGVSAVAEQALRDTINPTAKDANGEYRWKFGGTVPVATMFGALWDAIKGRDSITMTVSDGVTTYQLNQSVQLNEFELPVIGTTFGPANITVA